MSDEGRTESERLKCRSIGFAAGFSPVSVVSFFYASCLVNRLSLNSRATGTVFSSPDGRKEMRIETHSRNVWIERWTSRRRLFECSSSSSSTFQPLHQKKQHDLGQVRHRDARCRPRGRQRTSEGTQVNRESRDRGDAELAGRGCWRRGGEGEREGEKGGRGGASNSDDGARCCCFAGQGSSSRSCRLWCRLWCR